MQEILLHVGLQNKRAHVLTIENPIESVHSKGQVLHLPEGGRELHRILPRRAEELLESSPAADASSSRPQILEAESPAVGKTLPLEIKMKDSKDSSNPARAVGMGDARGVSIVEMLVVIVILSIVTAFAVMQIAGAQRAMRLTNSAREFTNWVEKARLDSLRRHAMSSGEMASVTIDSANSYTIIIDQNGDGALDPPRTIPISATHGATFSGVTVPTTVRFNWRGRPVDASGHPLNLAFSLRDANGNINPINLTSAGDASLGQSVEASNVSVSEVNPNSNIKAKTSVPYH